jgi:hypothetical protein
MYDIKEIPAGKACDDCPFVMDVEGDLACGNRWLVDSMQAEWWPYDAPPGMRTEKCRTAYPKGAVVEIQAK